MSGHEDLPLFRWTPPSVEVIPFPSRARVGKIRRAAEMIAGTTERGASAYWRRALGDLRGQMEAASIPSDKVEAELAIFKQAVQAELNRRAYGRSASPGGDAA